MLFDMLHSNQVKTNIIHKMKNLELILKRHPKSHLIWDFDGTITDLIIDWTNFREGLFELYYAKYPDLKGSVPNTSGMGNRLYNLAVEKYGQEAKQIGNAYFEAFEARHYSSHLPNKEALSFIYQNKDEYTYSIWTNNFRSTILPILDELKLPKLMRTIVTKTELTYSKPNPDGFAQIHTTDQLSLDAYLMIGDSENDELAAKAAGIDFFKV